jgi:hypothetical protein
MAGGLTLAVTPRKGFLDVAAARECGKNERSFYLI